jgi:putative chitinase
MRLSLLKRCFPNGSQWVEIYHYPLNFTMKKYEIMSSQRRAMFLAQIAHESGELRYKEELASGSAYEGRLDLGNVYPGDGKRYKGRGLIQLTGRANYREYGLSLGIDLENKPELALEPLNSALIAGCYWTKKELNKFADLGTLEGFRVITKRINGGLNGWEDRVKHWERIRTVIK